MLFLLLISALIPAPAWRISGHECPGCGGDIECSGPAPCGHYCAPCARDEALIEAVDARAAFTMGRSPKRLTA